MYRLIVFSIQLILLLIILSFVFTNPFIISLDVSDFKYSISSNIFAVIIIFFLISVYFFYIYSLNQG